MQQQAPPHDLLKYFFQALHHGQCHICWNLFSKKSQDVFLEWALKDIYRRHQEAATTAKIGLQEVRLLFENNDSSLMTTFWRTFRIKSYANQIFSYGYFDTLDQNGPQAMIRASLKLPNGSEHNVDMPMVFERGGWKFAYIEGNLPFE